MKRVHRQRTVFIVLAAIAVLGCTSAATILAACNNAITVRAGNLVLLAEDTISPAALPKNRMAPITLHVHGELATVDGSHVLPAQTVHLQVDRHIRIESTGLPSCTLAKIESTVPSEARKACASALIGEGSATAQVQSNLARFSAKGSLLSFNGPTVGGHPEMLWYAYMAVPVPTEFLWVAKLSTDSGRYAYEISQTIPELLGGTGSLTGFEITLGRKWTYKGRPRSFLSAECPDGRFTDQLEVGFGDGTNLSGTVVNSCQSKVEPRPPSASG